MWFKQTINNACGLYGVLHAVSNGDARAAISESFPTYTSECCLALFDVLSSCSDFASDHRLRLTRTVPDSVLAKLLNECLPLKSADRALALEQNDALESAYREAALQGDSEVPASAEDEVDFHYVCFVMSHKNGYLYQMDGDRKGHIEKGPLGPDEDLFAGRTLDIVKQFVQRENDGNLNFGLLALVRDD